MKINISEKEKNMIAQFLKILACVLAVIFLVRGFIKVFSSKKSDAQEVNGKTEIPLQENNSTGDGSWVDDVISSGEEEIKVPVMEMTQSVNFPVVNGVRGKLIQCAKKYLGVPYRYGGADEDGMDCSGFVYRVVMDAGLEKLPKSSSDMFAKAAPIERDEMIPGDLVFFIRDGLIFHVAIFLGENQIIHSISDGPKTGVVISSLEEKYWAEHYYSCGRFLDDF